MLRIKRMLVNLLSAAVLLGSMSGAAQAGMIGSGELLDADARAQRVQAVEAFLARDTVAQQLADWGVDATVAEARVASLSDAELRELALNIENAPAGAGIIEIVGVVFVVLLILELVGVTDIFTSF